MKQFIFRVLFLAMLLPLENSFADACAVSFIPDFSPNQAKLICSRLGTLPVGQSLANFEAVAGAGTTQGTAAALSAVKYVHQLTGADGTVGWLLPAVAAAKKNQVHIFLNTTAAVAKLYPETGGTINGASANAAFSALTGIKPIICVVSGAATWICS